MFTFLIRLYVGLYAYMTFKKCFIFISNYLIIENALMVTYPYENRYKPWEQEHLQLKKEKSKTRCVDHTLLKTRINSLYINK